MAVGEMHCEATADTLTQSFLHGAVTGGQSPNLLQSQEVETLAIQQAQRDTDYKPSTSSSGMRTACRQVPGKQDSRLGCIWGNK